MTRLLVYILALFRFTMLLHEEEGPGGVLLDLRALLGVDEFQTLSILNDGSPHQEFTRESTNIAGEALNCPFCLSGWLAIPLALGYYNKWRLMDVVAAWGAIWAGAYFLFKLLGYSPIGEDE